MPERATGRRRALAALVVGGASAVGVLGCSSVEDALGPTADEPAGGTTAPSGETTTTAPETSTTAQPTTTAASEAAIATCDLITREEAERLLGGQVTSGEPVSSDSGGSACRFEAADGTSGLVLLQRFPSEDFYPRPALPPEQVRDVEALGDRAFVLNTGDAIGWVQNGEVLFLTVTGASRPSTTTITEVAQAIEGRV